MIAIFTSLPKLRLVHALLARACLAPQGRQPVCHVERDLYKEDNIPSILHRPTFYIPILYPAARFPEHVADRNSQSPGTDSFSSPYLPTTQQTSKPKRAADFQAILSSILKSVACVRRVMAVVLCSDRLARSRRHTYRVRFNVSLDAQEIQKCGRPGVQEA